jgi:C4-dicarboxylate-specific signal transduction histidine kinase
MLEPEAIQVTGKKIEKIMNTVRALSHGGDAEPLQQSTVRAVIDSALDIVGARLRDHGMTLLVSLRDGETKIECRPTEVFQILVNLLSNAHDAVGEMEEKKIWISSELDREGQGVLIRVMDSGPGIPVDIRKKLFSPFFTTKQIGVGTGLGLTISSGLATRNGAKLWLDEQHPKTCFCLWLPLRGPHFALHS